MKARLRDPRLLIGLELSIGLLLVSRLFILTRLTPSLSDVPQYVEYAQDYEHARHAGRPFREFHREAVQLRLQQERPDLPPAFREWRSQIEYPPMAVSWIVLASTAWPRLTNAVSGDERGHHVSFRLSMAVVDAATFVLLIASVMGLSRTETPQRVLLRLTLYVLLGLLLGHLLYDRVDLLLGGAILLSLALLLSGHHFGYSFALLAVGINLKLVPLVLAPLWIVFSLPCSTLANPWTSERVRLAAGAFLGRTVWIVLPTVALMMAFWVVEGDSGMSFLRFHTARGLEMGSLYTTGLLALRELGLALQTVYEYGSYGVSSPLASAVAAASPMVTLGCVGVAYAMLMRAVLADLPVDNRGNPSVLSALGPSLLIEGTVLLLMVVIATSKVFSPQYLLWLVPLLPLIGIDDRRSRLVWVLLTLVCIVTTIIWPTRFHRDIVGQVSTSGSSVLATGPTPLGIGLLAVRNVLFGVATAIVLWGITRRRAVGAPDRASGERSPRE